MSLTVGQTYYSINEAAEILGLSLSSVRNYCYSGRIHIERIGDAIGAFVISATELERFKAAKKPRGNPNFKKHSAE